MTPKKKFTISKLLLPLVCFLLVFYSCQKSENDDTELSSATNTPKTGTNTSPLEVKKPGSVDGPMPPTSSIPYSQINNKEYTIEIDRWDIPNDRKEPVKTSDNIQAAIDWAAKEGYGIVNLPAGHYLVGKDINGAYNEGFNLRSNMAFLLDKDAIIEMNTNNKWNYCVIDLWNLKNVVVSGGTIIGDKKNHIYTPTAEGKIAHDEGHCICIQAKSENVTIENMTLKEGTGDGVFLIAQDIKNTDAKVKNIVIKNNNIGYNRRQGISIVGAENVLIQNNEIHHTKGTNPEFGIDIESWPYNSNTIHINSNYFHNNVGHVLNFDGIDTIIENNIMEQGQLEGRHSPIISWNKANVIFRKNSMTVNNKNLNGFMFNAYENPSVRNEKPNEIYENTFVNCGIVFQKHQNVLIRDNNMDFGHINLIDMRDVTVTNNNITHDNICWPYRFKNVIGSASGNTYNGIPTIGLQLIEGVAFTGACQKN